MSGFDVAETDKLVIGPWFGSEHSFFTIYKPVVLYTWITLVIITLILLIARYALKKRGSLGHFIVISCVKMAVDLIRQTLTANFSFNHFVFLTTTFCFVFACNVVSLIPWMEEPTSNLNTTLALGLVSFFYTQGAAIQSAGLGKYLKGYFSPFFIMMPLNVVGKLATIVSISFRLFGNIFGGSIVSTMYFNAIKKHFLLEFIGLTSGVNLIVVAFFGLFEGALQAFVFFMLSLTYLSLALQEEGH